MLSCNKSFEARLDLSGVGIFSDPIPKPLCALESCGSASR